MSTYEQSSPIDIPVPVAGRPLDAATFATLRGIEATLQTVLKSTRGLFGDSVHMVLEDDPETPDDLCIVFEARTRGEVDEVLAMEDQWHGRCIELAGKDAVFFRLRVDLVS